MNNVQEFNNSSLGKCRVIGNKENPLFCLKDVCDVLEMQNPTMVKNSIQDEFGDDLNQIYPIVDNLGRTQEATFITEPQLYFVLMRSDKPKAKPFRQWVINEVLPSIRKTGGYSLQEVNHKENKALYEKIIALQEEVISLYRQMNISRNSKPVVVTEYEILKIKNMFNEGISTKAISRHFGIPINKVLEILQCELV